MNLKLIKQILNVYLSIILIIMELLRNYCVNFHSMSMLTGATALSVVRLPCGEKVPE